MGSFNVSCSVSNMTIAPGDECIFLPLYRNSYTFPDKESLSSMFIGMGPTQANFFYPFSLPIFGKYDDYGRIGNVERTKTVESLEKYFNISIDQFVDIITSGREPHDTYSDLYKIFGINKEVNSKVWDFSSKYLLDLGFVKEDVYVRVDGFVGSFKPAYRFKDHEAYVRVVIKKTNKHKDSEKRVFYKIYSKGKLRKQGFGYGTSRFLEDYYKVTGYFLCYPDDKQATIKLLASLSGMFVNKEIYDSLSEYEMGEEKPIVWENTALIDEFCLERFGFVKSGKDDSEERYNIVYKHPKCSTYEIHTDGSWSHIYSLAKKKTAEDSLFYPKEFVKVWNNLPDNMIELKIPADYENKSIYLAKFDAYSKLLNKQYLMRTTAEDTLLYRLLDMEVFLTQEAIPFLERFNKGKFQEIYLESLIDGSIRDEFVKFANFFSNLGSLNKFLFPGPYAGQGENVWPTKILTQKVAKVLNKKEKEIKDRGW